MASISSLMGSTSSSGSIYGSRNSNIISGLASGLDTEAMIEGLVQGYQQKITGLEQDRTKLQWQQEAYQSISDKLVEFSRKYTSYTSGTNLLSSSFFNNAVVTTTNGSFANLVSASGKTSSDVILNAVAQLATAAKYTVDNTRLGSLHDGVVSSSPVSLEDKTVISTMDGSLTLTYGHQKVTLDFGELEKFGNLDDGLDVEAFKKAVNEKLKEQEVSIGGKLYSAADVIGFEMNDRGEVTLTDKLGAGNSVYISGASGNFADRVNNLDDAVKNKSASFSIQTKGPAVQEVDTAEYLADKTFTVTLNGQTKKFTLDGIKKQSGEDFSDALVRTLNEKLSDAFGAGKVTVSMNSGTSALDFKVTGNGNTFSISSDAGEILGMEGGTLTSYLDTSKSLEDLLGDDMGGLTATGKDSEGRDLYALTINGVKVGEYTKDTSLETVINGINTSEAGVNVSYSKLTNQFVFTAKETGEGGRIEIEAGGLGEALFGTVDSNSNGYVAGQDAVFQATVNGSKMTFTRSTNTFDIDGMSITLNGTFNTVAGAGGDDGVISSEEAANPDAKLFAEGEAVTFTSKTDSDTIIDAVKSMVEDYNAIMEEVKKAYSDMPLKQSNGSRYEPLTDEERADMSESAIKEYEEKAKTGILFMDSDLSSLYNSLRSAITPGGMDGSFLRSIGIETAYSDGLTTLTLDEEALRQALETNPDQVRDAFTKSQEYGASTDGLMASIQEITDRYAATTGAVKGILIEKAGSQYSPTAALKNTMLDKMQEIDEQIERWQDKMTNQVDHYTNKFTQLEMLINQMNSQSSALAGLMGGY